MGQAQSGGFYRLGSEASPRLRFAAAALPLTRLTLVRAQHRAIRTGVTRGANRNNFRQVERAAHAAAGARRYFFRVFAREDSGFHAMLKRTAFPSLDGRSS